MNRGVLSLYSLWKTEIFFRGSRVLNLATPNRHEGSPIDRVIRWYSSARNNGQAICRVARTALPSALLGFSPDAKAP